MERPDLEYMMHTHGNFAEDVLMYQQKVGGCMWVLYTVIQGEEIAKPLKERPAWSQGSFVFHYHKDEVEGACREFTQHFHRSGRLH